MTPSQKTRADYLHRSAIRVALEAKENAVKKEFDRVIRKTHEALELLFKGLLIEQGIEPAKTHDLSQLYQRIANPKFQLQEDDLTFLTEQRIPAFYGAPDFVPDEDYSDEDCSRCLSLLAAAGL